jgi:hypothetical protein
MRTFRKRRSFRSANNALLGFAEWRKATGQETRDGKSTAVRLDSGVLTLPADYRCVEPRSLGKHCLFDALLEK